MDFGYNTSCWRDAIKKEMKNVIVAFNLLDKGDKPRVGYAQLKVHLVFNIKLDLTRKAQLVTDGHLTPDPVDSTYAGVVSRETVCKALTYAALHVLDIWTADIMNAFLQASKTEKYWIECGPEFVSDHIGKIAVVTRALYGVKSSARDLGIISGIAWTIWVTNCT